MIDVQIKPLFWCAHFLLLKAICGNGGRRDVGKEGIRRGKGVLYLDGTIFFHMNYSCKAAMQKLEYIIFVNSFFALYFFATLFQRKYKVLRLFILINYNNQKSANCKRFEEIKFLKFFDFEKFKEILKKKRLKKNSASWNIQWEFYSLISMHCISYFPLSQLATFTNKKKSFLSNYFRE